MKQCIVREQKRAYWSNELNSMTIIYSYIIPDYHQKSHNHHHMDFLAYDMKGGPQIPKERGRNSCNECYLFIFGYAIYIINWENKIKIVSNAHAEISHPVYTCFVFMEEGDFMFPSKAMDLDGELKF